VRRDRPPRPVTGFVVLVVGVALAAGVGLYHVIGPSEAGDYAFYVAPGESESAKQEFVLLDWTTNADGALTGHLRSVDPAAGGSSGDRTLAVTGHQDGSSVDLTTSSQGVPQRGRGSLEGDTLVLRVSDGHGVMITHTLRHTTPEEFDRMVADYRRQLTQPSGPRSDR
jgi:hypothetical protein